MRIKIMMDLCKILHITKLNLIHVTTVSSQLWPYLEMNS